MRIYSLFLNKRKNAITLYCLSQPDNDLDAITSTSIVGNEDKVFNELTAEIDVLISKI
jgi:hypothetical protein